MPSYNVFFFGAAFFLIGILLTSFGLSFVLILVVTFLLGAIFLFWGLLKGDRRLFWLAGLSILIFIGSFYFIWDDKRFQNINISFDEKAVFSGLVVSDPEIKLASQELKIGLKPPFNGNVLVRLNSYPRFDYGDVINFEGIVRKAEPEGYAKYLAKERISGVSYFPKAELVESGRGAFIKEKLFNLKNNVIGSFQKVLPAQEAAFLSGLTVGERGEFSEEFKEAMSKSGTTHLVALSGYNITIIAWAAASLFLYFFSRRLSFFMTVLLILGFVAMTGAEASVVRAAIMGILVLFAKELGRIFDFRNAIMLAALIMVLFNPKVLVFDVGFQLSFLALLGIIYLKPALMRIFKVSEEPGFLAWRGNLFTTFSAQLAVAPILISNFGNFSLTSFLANVIILETVPVAMGMGFIVAFLSFISYYLSLILGWAVWFLLRFEILAIEFFSKITLPFSPNISVVSATAYYLALVLVIVYVSRADRVGTK